jgi:uncharacterized small protein (DUF1192 family)
MYRDYSAGQDRERGIQALMGQIQGMPMQDQPAAGLAGLMQLDPAHASTYGPAWAGATQYALSARERADAAAQAVARESGIASDIAAVFRDTADPTQLPMELMKRASAWGKDGQQFLYKGIEQMQKNAFDVANTDQLAKGNTALENLKQQGHMAGIEREATLRAGLETLKANLAAQGAARSAAEAAQAGPQLPGLSPGWAYSQGPQGIEAVPMRGTAPWQEGASTVASIEDSMDRIRRLHESVKQRGTETFGAGSKEQAMLYGTIVSDIGKIRQLGTMQAGDLKQVEDSLPNPSGWMAGINPMGASGAEAGLAEAYRAFERLHRAAQDKFGRWGGLNRPPPVPLGGIPIAPRAKR